MKLTFSEMVTSIWRGHCHENGYCSLQGWKDQIHGQQNVWCSIVKFSGIDFKLLWFFFFEEKQSLDTWQSKVSMLNGFFIFIQVRKRSPDLWRPLYFLRQSTQCFQGNMTILLELSCLLPRRSDKIHRVKMIT